MNGSDFRKTIFLFLLICAILLMSSCSADDTDTHEHTFGSEITDESFEKLINIALYSEFIRFTAYSVDIE